GDDATQVFPVAISRTATVGILKEAIKDKKQVAFQHVDANDLALWKVSIPVDDSFDANVERENKQVLVSVKRLSHLFPHQPDDQNLHIIIRSPHPPILELYCLVRGDDADHIFPVKIASTESVGTLKEIVREKNKFALEHMDAKTLTLWKVSIPVDDSFKENVKKVELEDAGSLSPVDILSEIFLHPPQRRHLHIVVQVPRIGECMIDQLLCYS
ncbi:uncharacterized protein EI90DRAFT_2944264, partial [Cantharellus anzutake]|uniref:uncharacterized protein n=1 Tax=Cantharellus anzutake TaxID=1750568 RepID=UPI0019039675